MVIIDTNIIIDHLRCPKNKISLLLKIARCKPKESLALSVVSVQELYEGLSTLNKLKEQFLLATITPFKILPYNYEIAKLAGQISRDLGRPIELADAAIAATAIINNCELLTLNQKDFFSIPKLKIIKL